MAKLTQRIRKIRLHRPNLKNLSAKRKIYTQKTLVFVKRHPFRALFIVLAIFLLLMIVGNTVFAPKKSNIRPGLAPKAVNIYKVGSAPEITYQGKVEKSGVTKIVAQTPGIVQSINVSEGAHIGLGANILALSTNYQGGNAATVSRQIAGTQYANAKDTYNTQKDIIAKQRDLANKNKDNADLMRQISAQSATSTAELVSLDQDLVNTAQDNLDDAKAGGNTQTILGAQQALSGAKAALIQATSSQQSLTAQSNSTSTDIANLQHDIAIKQLDVQERALQMTLNVAGLQLRLAQIMEGNMFPVAPFAGTVDKIFVHEGDSVNPGTRGIL